MNSFLVFEKVLHLNSFSFVLHTSWCQHNLLTITADIFNLLDRLDGFSVSLILEIISLLWEKINTHVCVCFETAQVNFSCVVDWFDAIVVKSVVNSLLFVELLIFQILDVLFTMSFINSLESLSTFFGNLCKPVHVLLSGLITLVNSLLKTDSL